jgi:hypothetical protein
MKKLLVLFAFLIPGLAQAQSGITKIGGGVAATATPAPTATVQPSPTVVPVTDYLPAADTQTIIKGSADASKLLRFEVDGLSAATTRVATVPNSDFTFMGINIDQSVSGQYTFSNAFNEPIIFAANQFWRLGPSGSGSIGTFTAQTPDSPYLATGTISNSWHVAESGDAFSGNIGNCQAGSGAATDPEFCVHSADGSSTTKAVSLRHNQTNAVIWTGLGGLILPGAIHTAGTAPAVSNTTANSCGTSAASLAGTDTTGIVTVGATSGTSCTITFVVAAPVRRQCVCTNETTPANICGTAYLTTGTSKLVGTFVAADVLSYLCFSY